MLLSLRLGRMIAATVLVLASVYGCTDTASTTRALKPENADLLGALPKLVTTVVVRLDAQRIAPNQSTQATAVAYGSDGAPITGKIPLWTSSNPQVGLVDPTGVVSALSLGSASIRATIDGVTGSAPLVVALPAPPPDTTPPPPPPPTQLAITTQPAGASSGARFSTQPIVEVRDSAGNRVTTSTAAIAATIASGSGTLSGTTTVNAVNGVANFTDLTITGSGPHTLRMASAGLTSAMSNSFTVAPPPPPPPQATKLSITTQPSSSAQSGVVFARQPVIQLRDESNNAVSQSGVTVNVVIASGGGTLGGTATVTTNASGVASFTNLSITGQDGSRTLQFTAMSLTTVTSSAISVTTPVTPPPTGDEPVFNPSVNAMVYQDNMDSYTSATAMGAAGQTGPRITPNPSPMTTSSAVQTSENSVITGRDGTGKALRMSFSGGSQTSATFITWNMPSTPTLATHYFQYWARVNFASSFNGTLAVKWFEAWHVHTDRVQWNTHDHLPCATDGHATYWQVYDQSRETTCQGNQPIGPYFNNVADNQWHRFTYSYRPNSASGARDGFARMWIDGVKVVDVSAATIGVTPPNGEKPWCSADDVDNLAVNDGMFNQFWGSTQTTNTPAWTYDIDDYRWWM